MRAFREAVAALAPAGLRMYAPDKVPPVPQYPYLVVNVVLGAADNYLLSADHGSRGGEVVVQAFGHTSDSAADVMHRFLSGVLDQRPVTAGWDVGPCVLGLAPTETDDRDNGGVYGLTGVLTFTAIKELSA